MGGPVCVVVTDDDVLLREGLASLLEGSGFDVVGRVGDERSCSVTRRALGVMRYVPVASGA